MRGVEVGRPQLRMRLGVEADRPHEGERLGDAVGDFLIALGLRTVLDEAEHPTMGVLEIGVSAGGEGAQEVQCRGGLAIGLELPARLRLARFRGELDVVDDVAAIGRQRDAVDRLRAARPGLGELAGDPADLDDRRGGGKGHDHGHLQEDAEEIADVVGRMLGEALGAVAALKQERFARRGSAEHALELPRLAGENERRIAGELALGLAQRRRVTIDGRLLDRLRPPAVGGPTRVRHSPDRLSLSWEPGF